MGELCESCVREHDAVRVLALRPPQAERCARAVHVLLLDTERHHGPPQFSDRCVFSLVACLFRPWNASYSLVTIANRTMAPAIIAGRARIALVRPVLPQSPPALYTARHNASSSPKRPLMPPKVKISLIQPCSCNICAFVAVAHLYSFALGVWYSRTLTLSDCVLISHCIRLTGPSACPRATV